ncbi:MAG: putative baseplate assembly protein [Bacteroidia bacterium]
MNAADRRQALVAQNRVTGIDFIYVHATQTQLDVHFLRSPDTLVDAGANPASLVTDLTIDQIRIYSPSGGESLPEVPITAMSWAPGDGDDYVLELTTAFPGDFSRYKLHIDDSRVDRYFNNLTLNFKANCPSDLDCKTPTHECPPEAIVDFPINYLARDFGSFRRALLDYASLRYPDWTDRLEADAGVMLVEVMSALGDEMAYFQDRIGREAYLETATQRRSVRKHARLVDYEMHDGLGASTWLDVTVAAGMSDLIPAGADVWAAGEKGEIIEFEIGNGLIEVLAGKTYAVDSARNEFEPHCWDEDDTCLPIGATEMYLSGDHAAALPFDDFAENEAGMIVPGKWVLLQTLPLPDRPVKNHRVRLIEVTADQDPVFGTDITRVRWETAQALPFEMDMTRLRVRGNLLPITAGKTYTALFVTGATPDSLPVPETAYRAVKQAVERQGPQGSVTYLFSLPGSEDEQLVWLGKSPQAARPEIFVQEVSYDGSAWVYAETFATLPDFSENGWQWRRSLMGTASSQPLDRHYTLEDGSWRRVVGYQRLGTEIVHQDYASNRGQTIRFGDGEFGLMPAEGTVFEVTYRLGDGRRSNVPAESLSQFEPSLVHNPVLGTGFVQAVSNPFAAVNGTDPEALDEVRRNAPEAFRALTFRAVRPEDYAEAAERLDWVQQAGAAFRWTGSWLSAFVTPDPKGAVVIAAPQRAQLANQLDKFRQAGREAHISDPVYASLDLEIHICVAPHAFAGEVKARVLTALLGKKGVRPVTGYLSPDHFTFGDPLDRSGLEAAIQAVEGVRAVEKIRFRRRGWFDWQVFQGASYAPGDNVIIRVQNNPLFPERGTLKLIMNGGA